MTYLIVFVGAGVGGVLRHAMNIWAVRAFGYGFPLGTLIVNVLGSFVMGLLVGFFAYRAGLVPQHLRLFLTTGVLGGFTTFSAFSLDAALLFERHSYSMAMSYIVGSVFASLVALFLGLALFNGVKPLP
jgi:CrcB protein